MTIFCRVFVVFWLSFLVLGCNELTNLPKDPTPSTSIHIWTANPLHYEQELELEYSQRPYIFLSKDTSYLYDKGMKDTLYFNLSEKEWLAWYSIFVENDFDKMEDPDIPAVYRCPCSDIISLDLGKDFDACSLSKPSGTYYRGVYASFEDKLLTKKYELAKPYLHTYTIITDSSIFDGNDIRHIEYGAYAFSNERSMDKTMQRRFLEGQHVFNLELSSINRGDFLLTTLISLDGKQDTIYLELDKNNNLVYKLL
ncbi:MAG: hypothetical protein GY810_14930 [Aureispira sp.]|nr:hypothetical protein [Aureispira sp.]